MVKALRDILAKRRQYDALKKETVAAAIRAGIWWPDSTDPKPGVVELMPRFLADKVKALEKRVAYLEDQT